MSLRPGQRRALDQRAVGRRRPTAPRQPGLTSPLPGYASTKCVIVFLEIYC
jgi:hypothetical protein